MHTVAALAIALALLILGDAQVIAQCAATDKIFIDPRLAPQRSHISREQLADLLSNPYAAEWMKKAMRHEYMNQNQPIAVPYSGGTVLIHPHKPCIQQFIGK